LVFDREESQFKPRRNACLLEDIRKVPFYGLFAKLELPRYVAVAATFNNATYYF